MKDWSYLTRLFDDRRAERTPVIVAGVGCGLTAKAAVAGGADFIATYSTARYRVQGLPTGLAFLPYDNCNDITFSLVPEVLAATGDVPLILGLGAHDPRVPVETLLNRTEALGVYAVTNEPFVGMYGETFKKQLDAVGFGINKEIELIRKAANRGMLTLAYVFDSEEALKFADAGATMLAIMVGGVTSGGAAGGKTDVDLDEAVDTINEILDKVLQCHPNLPVLTHGGPLNSVNSVEYVYNRTRTIGYVTGSTGERLPVEVGVKEAISRFKQISKGER